MRGGGEQKERTRYGLITFMIPEGWTREASPSLWFSAQRSTQDMGPSSRQYVLSSPRGEGRVCISTIAMPEDMGVFDCDRLKKLVDQKPRNQIVDVLMGAPFDRTEWSEGGVSCIGYSRVMKTQEPPPASVYKELGLDPPAPPTPSGSFRSAAAVPAIQRDWYMAFESDMANIWYCGMNADDASIDITNLELMLKSVRFNRAS